MEILPHQIIQADHGIERRTDFMAHPAEEFRLRISIRLRSKRCFPRLRRIPQEKQHRKQNDQQKDTGHQDKLPALDRKDAYRNLYDNIPVRMFQRPHIEYIVLVLQTVCGRNVLTGCHVRAQPLQAVSVPETHPVHLTEKILPVADTAQIRFIDNKISVHVNDNGESRTAEACQTHMLPHVPYFGLSDNTGKSYAFYFHRLYADRILQGFLLIVHAVIIFIHPPDRFCRTRKNVPDVLILLSVPDQKCTAVHPAFFIYEVKIFK